MVVNQEKGAITIFLTGILIVVLVFIGLLIDGTRIRNSEVQVKRATEQAIKSALSDYNPQLKKDYGLFAIKDEKKIESTITEYLQKNLIVEDAEKSLDLYDFKVEDINITPIYNFTQLQVEKNQILQYMKYRAPKNLVQEFLGKFNELKDTKRMTEVMKAKEDVDKELYNIAEIQKKIRDGLVKINDFEHDTSFKINNSFMYSLNDTINDYKTLLTFDRILSRYKSDKVVVTELQTDKKKQKNLNDMMFLIKEWKNKIHGIITSSINNYISENREVLKNIEELKDHIKNLKGEKDENGKEDKEKKMGYLDILDEKVAKEYPDQSKNNEESFEGTIKKDVASYHKMIPNDDEIKDIVDSINNNISVLNNISATISKINTEYLKLDSKSTLDGNKKAALDSCINSFKKTKDKVNDLITLTGKQMLLANNFYEDINYLNDRFANKISAFVAGYNTVDAFKGENKDKGDKSDESSAEGDIKKSEENTKQSLKDESAKEICSEKDFNKLPSKNPEVKGEDFSKADKEYLLEEGFKMINSKNGKEILEGIKDSGSLNYNYNYKDNKDNNDSNASYGFINNICDFLAKGLKNFRDKIYIDEYAVSIFSDAVKSNKSIEADKKLSIITGREPSVINNEIEYLIGGKRTDGQNLSNVKTKIFLIRFVPNIMHIYQDKTKNSVTQLAAEAIIGWTGLGQAAVPLVKAGLMAAWSSAESINDIKLLLNGEKISFFKNDKEWKIDMFAAFKSKVTNSSSSIKAKEGLKWNYEDYLRMLLLVDNEENILKKIGDLVQTNMQSKDKDYEISKSNTNIRVEATVSMKYLFMTQGFMPKEFKTKAGNRYKIKVILYQGY